MQAFDLKVLFEEVYPSADIDALCTFRVDVEATDIDHWNISQIESRSWATGEWQRIASGPWHDVFLAYATSEAGYRLIETAIREAMHEQAERALFDAADTAHNARKAA